MNAYSNETEKSFEKITDLNSVCVGITQFDLNSVHVWHCSAYIYKNTINQVSLVLCKIVCLILKCLMSAG